MTNDKPAREFNLKEANKVIRGYIDNDVTIDNGNLFFAALEYQDAYQALKLENERLEKELTFEGRLRNGLQEALITTLKAENAELRAENKKLETDVFILSKTDKITIHRILEPGNAFYQECFKKNTETIRDLQSEVARLRELGLKMASYITDVGQYEAGDQFREALNHKPKGDTDENK